MKQNSDYCVAEELKLFEREYRDLSHVPRWGIIPVIKRQTVAEHKYYVTLYISHICKALNLGCHTLVDALQHGLEHDRSECYTSDIPGPVKRSIVDSELEAIFEDNEDARRFETHKHDQRLEVVLIRKLADLLDEYAYWFEEYMLGNRRAGQMMKVIQPALLAASDKVGVATSNRQKMKPKVLKPFFDGLTDKKIVPNDPRGK